MMLKKPALLAATALVAGAFGAAAPVAEAAPPTYSCTITIIDPDTGEPATLFVNGQSRKQARQIERNGGTCFREGSS